MEDTGKIKSEEIKIQGLIDRYLKLRTAENGSNLQEDHLDDDSLTAFVEGNLSERESQPIVKHLVDCSFCRHITTELVRLDLAFAGEQIEPVSEEQPSKVSEVLNGLLSRIFGSGDGVVFAHHESEEKPENEEEEKKS